MRFFSICLTIAASGLSQAASFDCNKASQPVEHLICDTPSVSKLDEALAISYGNMIASNIGKGARSDLKLTQRKWLISRGKCTDAACLEKAYRSRIDEVCEYPVISGIHPGCTYPEDMR